MSEQSANYAFMPRQRVDARANVDAPGERATMGESLTELIGRTAWFAGALLIGAGLACVLGNADFGVATIVWLVLIAVAAVFLIGASVRGNRAPAHQAIINAYTRGSGATLVYAGATWGAGAFLAGFQDNLLVLLVFSTAAILAAVALLRDRMPVLCFSLPALAACTAAALGLGILEAFLVAAAGACILGASEIAARLSDHPRDHTLTLS